VSKQQMLVFAPHEPTQAQRESGNYAKKRVRWQGMEIAIENPAGTVRRGVSRDGCSWESRMAFDYGYLNRTEGVDGDHVDCFVGPNPDAPFVYVVHARKYGAWDQYDEDKCMLNFDSEEDARAAFLASYDDPRFLGPITVLTVDDFKAKAKATLEKPTMIKSLLLFKSFRGHAGRPGQVGGSAPRMMSVRDEVGSSGSSANNPVSVKNDATMSREDAKRRVLKEHDGGRLPVMMDGVSYYLSAKALNKMTAEHGEGGVSKPYQRERILAIQSLDELAANAKVAYREDRKEDPDVDLIAEGRALFSVAGTDYVVRLLGKIWRQGANRNDKLHSIAIEDVIVEKPGADQLSLGTGSNLQKNLGIDRLGISGNHLSASVAFERRIQRIRNESSKLFKATGESPADLIKEHQRLVDVLRSPSHEDDLEEADKQEDELEEYEGKLEKSVRVLLYANDGLLQKGGKGSGNFGHAGRGGKRGGSAPTDHVPYIEETLKRHAMPWRHLDFSEEAWRQEFPDGVVETPIGKVKLGDNQHSRLQDKGRSHYFGLIRPTLEFPAFIISEHRPSDKGSERDSNLVYIRAFIKPDGEHIGFCSVTIGRDGLEISVSSGPKRVSQLARKIKEGAILGLGSTVSDETASSGSEDGFSKAVSCLHFTQDWIDFKPDILAKAITRSRADSALNYRLQMIAAELGPLSAQAVYDASARSRLNALVQERYTLMVALGDVSI